MILKLMFGLNSVPIKVQWDRDLMEFPVIVNHNHQNWEWIIYNALNDLTADDMEYEVIFGELKTYDPRANEIFPMLSDIIASTMDTSLCDCGASKQVDSGGHWNFCKTQVRS